jgi:hypothetical protein
VTNRAFIAEPHLLTADPDLDASAGLGNTLLTMHVLSPEKTSHYVALAAMPARGQRNWRCGLNRGIVSIGVLRENRYLPSFALHFNPEHPNVSTASNFAFEIGLAKKRLAPEFEHWV